MSRLKSKGKWDPRQVSRAKKPLLPWNYLLIGKNWNSVLADFSDKRQCNILAANFWRQRPHIEKAGPQRTAPLTLWSNPTPHPQAEMSRAVGNSKVWNKYLWKCSQKLAFRQICIPNSLHPSKYKNFLSLVLFKVVLERIGSKMPVNWTLLNVLPAFSKYQAHI